MSLIPSLKTVFHSHTTSLIGINPIQLINILFVLCSTNTHGGAVFIESSLINVSLFLCTFDRCSASSNGGGFCSKISFQSTMHSCCFFDCTAFRCPGFIFWDSNTPTSHKTLYSTANFSNEYNPKITGFSSAIYSDHKTNYNNNNVSRSLTDGFSAGIYFGSSSNTHIGSFNNFFNNSGPAFTGFYDTVNGNLNKIEYFNYISCKSSNVLGFFVFSTKMHIQMKNSVFIDCNSYTMVYGQAIGTCTLTFENCYFNFIYDSNKFIDCTTISCQFNIIKETNQFEILNTYQCWNGSPNFYTSNFEKTFYQKIIIPLFLILI